MSASPTPYARSYSFTDFSAASPTVQQPGTQLDAQLDAVALSTANLVSRLSEIQREDGAVRNGVVGLDALSQEAKRGLAMPSVWLPLTGYAVGNQVIVVATATLYLCIVAHTSDGTFSATNWTALGIIPGINGSNITDASIEYVKLTAAAIAALTAALVPVGATLQSKIGILVGFLSCTTYIPFDSTYPQSTEGDLVKSLSITPIYATSKIRCTFFAKGTFSAVSSGTSLTMIAALFKSGDTNSLTTGFTQIKNTGFSINDLYCSVTFCGEYAVSTTSPVTFNVRCGSAGTQLVTVGYGPSNQLGSFGGTGSDTYLLLEEIKQ